MVRWMCSWVQVDVGVGVRVCGCGCVGVWVCGCACACVWMCVCVCMCVCVGLGVCVGSVHPMSELQYIAQGALGGLDPLPHRAPVGAHRRSRYRPTCPIPGGVVVRR